MMLDDEPGGVKPPPAVNGVYLENGRDLAAEWRALGPQLREWTKARMVNRPTGYGGYRTGDDGKTCPTTHKKRLTDAALSRHFGATKTDDVVGVHAIHRDEAGKCWSLWGAVDIDQHVEDGDVDANLRAALAWYDRASALGFGALLLDSNGRGGFHLVLLFTEPVPTETVYLLMKWLTRDFAAHGLTKQPETFPKQRAVTDEHPFGNWLRLPGRHHTRDHYTKVWDGLRWLDGTAAAEAIKATTGGSADLIPAEALTVPEPRQPQQADRPVSKGMIFTAGFTDATLARLALQYLGPTWCDDYDQWLKVGCTLFKLGPEGLTIWDEWSRGSSKYQDGACEAKWRTFTEDGVKLGSLFHWAEQAGWINPTARKTAENGTSFTAPGPNPGTNGAPDVVSLDDILSRRPKTELGNAERLVARHGKDLRFCHPWKKWLAWDGCRWRLDNTGEVRRRARRTVRAIFGEAKIVDDDDKRKQLAAWALGSETRDKLASMVHLAEVEDGIPILPDSLDRDPWLLNCLNGTLELKTGLLREHRRKDGITRVCPVTYKGDAECPWWTSTLHKIFAGNLDLIGFFQQLCGVALTGTTTEQILPILFGDGSNGKSTILNALLEMLGPDYAIKAPPELLMVKRNESHPTERAALFGKRLVVAIETNDTSRINEKMVKELTGSDIISARRMREDFWDFKPTHKIMLCTNHKPAVRGTDYAIWRRLKLIPFTVKIPDDQADKEMPEKLTGELSGILAWCVQGCLDWQEAGLNPPKEVTEATEEYRKDEDVLEAFLAEHCTINPALRAKATPLYERYRQSSERTGETPANQRKFGKAMTAKGFTRVLDNGTWYQGIGLRHEDKD